MRNRGRWVWLAVVAAMVPRCETPSTSVPMVDPVVVFTFDDGDESIYTRAFPIMRASDPTWGATHFLPANHPGSPGLVTVAQLAAMEAAGWETGGHGGTHENLSSVPMAEVERQVAVADSFLRVNNLSHESYAYAFGNYNDSVAEVVARRFSNIRTSHDMRYLDGINRLELGCYDAKSGHGTDDLIGRIEEARLLGSPMVMFCFHVIVPDSGATPPAHDWWTTESAFRGLCRYLVNREMMVVSVRDAMRLLLD